MLRSRHYSRLVALASLLLGCARAGVLPDDRFDWLKATPVSFPILFDVDSKVSKLYQVEGMPNTVILDRQGNVRYIHRGYSTGAENEYLDQIRALIRE